MHTHTIPCVTFKKGPEERLPKGMVICEQERGWVNDKLEVEWLKNFEENFPLMEDEADGEAAQSTHRLHSNSRQAH